MSAFKEHPELHKQVDYQIAVNGWVQFYRSNGALGNDQNWLDQAGYTTAEFHCHGLSHLFDQFNEYFHFPSYFHHNLNSFNDCLRDIEINGIGLIIVLKNLDNLKKEDSESLLEILIDLARLNFIVGKRVFILAHAVHSDFRLEHIKLNSEKAK